MRKKGFSISIVLLCCLQFTACGNLFVKDKPIDVTNETNITETKEDRRDVVYDMVPGMDHDQEKSIEQNTNVVLGGNFGKDEANYTYLYYEELMTDPEEYTLPVFIPNGDYTSINRDTAYADFLGVDFRVSLNPTIQYEQDNYLVSENLEYYLNDEYDPFYSTDYENLQISQIDATDTDAKAYVSYCYYDKWDNAYYPMYTAYYLKQINNDLTVLVEIKVDAENVTGKTDALIEELESFYGFNINWNKKSEELMLQDFLKNKDTTNRLFSTGYLLFELPRDWGEDYNYSDSEIQTFAPNEDASTAPCAISISREYLGSDCFTISDIFKDEKTKKEYLDEFKKVMGDTAINVSLTDGGTTCIGDALLIEFETGKTEDDVLVKWYMVTDDDYMYSVKAIACKDCDVDIDSIMENILLNSTLKD